MLLAIELSFLLLLAGIDYKLLFVEMVIDGHMAAVWVDLNVSQSWS